MATFFIELPGTLRVSAFAAIAVAGIYLLLRKRTGASRTRILVTSSLCLLAVMWAFGYASNHSSAASRSTAVSHNNISAHATTTGTLIAVSSRAIGPSTPVYGHSVVKGGIHTLGELLNVIATDPLAAEHYKGFDISKAHFIRLDHNIMAYVSYRVDGKGIYWSSKPELIMAGEEVITDGTNFIRVRCGNMISYAPQSPAETDSPTDTNTIVESFTPFSNPPLGAQNGIPPSGTPNGGPPPPGNLPPGCCSNGGSYPPPVYTVPNTPTNPGNPSRPTTPLTPTTPVDEFAPHGAFFTLLIAIVGLFLIRKLLT
jgi:hypothetical protein